MVTFEAALSQTYQLFNQLLIERPKCYIAVSGGLDSTCLAHMVHSWAMPRGLSERLVLIHIDHQIHADSRLWRAHCEMLAKRLAITYCAFCVDVVEDGRGVECAAREARWQVFKSKLSLDEVLLFGHHANDQIETGLYRMLRGSGLSGLQLMQPVSSLHGISVARPLLHWSRRQLEAYASMYGLTFINDPSNNNDVFDRNYLRHKVLPVLSLRWPALIPSMMRSFSHLQTDWQLLQDYARADLHQMTVNVCGLKGLDLKRLTALSYAQQCLLLRLSLQDRGWYLPATRQMNDFILQINNACPDKSVRLQTKQWVIVLSVGTLFFCRVDSFSIPSYTSTTSTDVQLTLHCPNVLTVDASSLVSLMLLGESWRWVFRSMLSGRSLRKCNRLLLKHRVPAFMREHVPVLQNQFGDLFFPEIIVVDA